MAGEGPVDLDNGDSGSSRSSSGDSGGSSSSSSDRSSKKDRKEPSKTRSAVADAGKRMSDRSVQQLQDIAARMGDRSVPQPEAPRYMNVPSFKRGGTMRKSGVARLHRGERIEKSKSGTGKRKKGRSRGR